MVFPKILKAAAAAMVLLINIMQANACLYACPLVYYTPCDYVIGPASTTNSLVIRATVVSRSLHKNINDPVTYTVDVTTVFLGDTGGETEISVVTAEGSTACGLSLEIREEYVLALYPTGISGQFTVILCGLWRKWSAIPDGERAYLEAGCANSHRF